MIIELVLPFSATIQYVQGCSRRLHGALWMQAGTLAIPPPTPLANYSVITGRGGGRRSETNATEGTARRRTQAIAMIIA